MKKYLFPKLRLIGITMIILTVGLLTGFAETTDKTPNCPSGTEAYLSRGVRAIRNCNVTITEHGYWWYNNGGVKWVERKMENCSGTFEIASKTTTYQGKEYICVGMHELCWACSCQYKHLDSTVEIQ